MSFELSFSPEFFTGEEDLYDVKPAEYPTSVWQALVSMQEANPDQWASMAQELFGYGIEYAQEFCLSIVMDRIRETNTCTDLRSPVEVWIDSEGDYTIRVFDKE